MSIEGPCPNDWTFGEDDTHAQELCPTCGACLICCARDGCTAPQTTPFEWPGSTPPAPRGEEQR